MGASQPPGSISVYNSRGYWTECVEMAGVEPASSNLRIHLSYSHASCPDAGFCCELRLATPLAGLMGSVLQKPPELSVPR